MFMSASTDTRSLNEGLNAMKQTAPAEMSAILDRGVEEIRRSVTAPGLMEPSDILVAVRDLHDVSPAA